jgi:hypothetical protein
MSMSQRINVYDSQSKEYHHAFQVFLDHTDQKLKAQQWLNRLVQTLPLRRVFIDAGAGNGKVTAWFTDAFNQTIALEPNESTHGTEDVKQRAIFTSFSVRFCQPKKGIYRSIR